MTPAEITVAADELMRLRETLTRGGCDVAA